ncbi:MAG: hypothetical protein BMS9Abin12_2309 [Acidimicrobiia bacterium]|nr:MAG: hypothetical protein BMS9Abin12_2309 [Acidimicrobiia bacterium]
MRPITPLVLIVFIILLLAGCAAVATQSSETESPDATPTAGAVSTSTSSTSQAPTTTTSATAEETTTSTIDPEPAMNSPFRAEPYTQNPVIEKPSEQGGAFLPRVVVSEGTFHMWFTQTTDWMAVPTAIFHATSSDGLEWNIDEQPSLLADGEGFDAFSVAEGTVVETGDGWVMYYNARAIPGPGPGPGIGRATAPSPNGPWVADPEPVLVSGEPGTWDSGFVTPNSAVVADGGVLLYYSGGTNYIEFAPTATGLAKSEDTSAFVKESVPVIEGASIWDGRFAWEAAVFDYDGGYAALYTGDPTSLTGEAIGYAWSPDGVTWESADDNPILQPRAQAWAGLDVVAGAVVETPDGRRLLFYSGSNAGLDFSIGVAELLPAD